MNQEAAMQPSTSPSQHVRSLELMANRLRRHSLVCTNEASSGHPTSAMSCAELVTTLFFHCLRFDFQRPHNPNNDRFILSKGHGSPLLWSVLAEAGAFPVEQLKTYRQFGSALEGHPTPRSPWVDAATGSLGQGLSIGLGMAFRSRFDLLDNRIYVLMGDGETAEGNVWEAVALAAHYKLGNLIAIVDVNRLGQTEETMYGHDVDSYAQRFEAFGWYPQVIDGHNVKQIIAAYEAAIEYERGPAVIIARTTKGKGVSFLEDENGRHGKPVTGDEFTRALQEIGDPQPEETLQVARPQLPETAVDLVSYDSQGMAPPRYEPTDQEATRKAYAHAITKLAKINPQVVALDAEVKNSTYAEEFLAAYPDRFIECYIAEQNMLGMAHGLSVLGKIPFCSSFAAFFTRAYDQLRMATISGAHICCAGSHAGISIGEDGPSQMGLEDIAMFRALHGSTVLYPADAVSAERMVGLAVNREGIVYLRLTRPKTPMLYTVADDFHIGGSHTLKASQSDRATIIAAGITVHEALKAAEQLEHQSCSVRVIDAYSIKPIDAAVVLRAAEETGTLLTVEDHYPEGGLGDAVLEIIAGRQLRFRKLAVNGMPRSGDRQALMDQYGISAANIVAATKELLATV
ncbi:MAG: transketolase [Candidatus Binatia bacterium]